MDVLLMSLLYEVEYLSQLLGTGFWWIHELCCYEPIDNSWFDPEFGVTGCINLDGLF